MKREILVDIDRCLGCKSCEIACAVSHSKSKDLFGVVLNNERALKRIFVSQAGKKNVPLTCRHCEEAPCIDACIAGAMYRNDEGIVTNEQGLNECVGCWMCVMFCPYGVIRSFYDTRKAIKCDRLCFDGTDRPACVRACPTGALSYVEVDEFSKNRRYEFLFKTLSES